MSGWHSRGHELASHKGERWRIVLSALELVLLLVGMTLLAVFLSASIKRALVSGAELKRFHIGQMAHDSNQSGELPRNSGAASGVWGGKQINSYEQSLLLGVDEPLADLRVSRVRLEAPVLEGTSPSILERGVGHISGTALPGQEGLVGIAGHRDSFFRPLKEVRLGDTIELKTPAGIYTYRVNKLLVVDPTETSVLQPTRTASLVLVTCYPFYFVGSAPKRYIVEAGSVALDLSQKKENMGKGLQLESMQRRLAGRFFFAIRRGPRRPKSIQEMTQ